MSLSQPLTTYGASRASTPPRRPGPPDGTATPARQPADAMRGSSEVCLLYAVTGNLRLSTTDDELAQLALDWLVQCVPALGCGILFVRREDAVGAVHRGRPQHLFFTRGDCPVDESQFLQLVASLEPSTAEPHLWNAREAGGLRRRWPGIRQLVAVPMREANNEFGWLAAFNHRAGGTFGPNEAKRLTWLGTLLGIHCGNRELYRQQSELLSHTVRALVSAIDAKDPYTSGHSDRVARFAVRIALEMRCNPKFVNTLYMAGLLHDVGKIGIDDSVLRKAGRLTELEFEHIKRHPELGFRILADLKPLAEVLPAVLHHHEQWDGRGYPLGLSGHDIPLIARILAVADAYDAMTTDRPYRQGMAEERVDEIFHEGAGTYWDRDVVDAFFRAKDDIRAIAQRERLPVDTLSQEWL